MRLRRPRSAQALVMVTFALIAIVALIGLAVDFGWMYFLQKNMQSAADAAALASVRYAMDRMTTIGDLACGGGVVTCNLPDHGTSNPVSCTSISSGNLRSACLYATQNGFNPATSGINVRVQASDAATAPTVVGCSPTVSHPPTTGCVHTFYWVTVRIAQQVPQLFSAITGNTSGIVAARATAAIAESTVLGSLILINRENDPIDTHAVPLGTNLSVQGSGTVTVPGGIILASSSSEPSNEAGRVQGGGSVVSPFTNIRETGTVGLGGGGTWTNPPANSPDSSSYYDPMYQKGGQPPLNTNAGSLPIHEVPGGVLNESICQGGICPPGIYYASEPACNGCPNTRPSGGPIRLGSPSAPDFRFAGTSSGFSNFGDFYFIGGLDVRSNTVLTLDPGRYAFLGVMDSRDPVLNIPNGVTLTGGTSENGDPGRILITTDFKPGSQYPGLVAVYQRFITSGIQGITDPYVAGWLSNGLNFSKTNIQAGQNDRSVVQIFGLKKSDPDVVAAGLNQFTPAVIWQDQHNSYVRYTTTGTVDASCNDLNNPCLNPTPDPEDAPQLEIWATPYARWGGMIYQPRGAWTVLHAGGNYVGPLMIVSGAMSVDGSPNLSLTGPATPLTVFTVALVE